MAKAATVEKSETAGAGRVVITAPKFKTVAVRIVGTAPLVQHRFGAKAREQMHDTQAQGALANKSRKKEPKDFMALYEDAKHVAEEGWCGIPASAFRQAMVSACRIVGFKMTLAKLGVFVEADGYSKVDGTPLVRITKGEPVYLELPARNDDLSCDLRARPMWHPGWEAVVRIRIDAEMFTPEDVANLMHRVGQQVGIGEGRPDSKKSCGMGWGMFTLAQG